MKRKSKSWKELEKELEFHRWARNIPYSYNDRSARLRMVSLEKRLSDEEYEELRKAHCKKMKKLYDV